MTMPFRSLSGSPPDGLAHAAEFYDRPRGRLTGQMLGERLARALPPSKGRQVLALGYPGPFLPHAGLDAGRLTIGRPDRSLTRIQPGEGQGAVPTIAIDDTTLPFQDLSIDLVLAIHALELSPDPRETLRAIWKVLADDGKLVLVLPNRRGLWAHGDSTPFGHGTPYSAGQIARVLSQSMFRAETITGALALPPLGLGAARKLAPPLDRTLNRLGRRIAGVHIVIASKDAYAGVPLLAENQRGGLARRLLEPLGGSVA